MTIKDLWADLHVHSHYSDGLLSPDEMVRKARDVSLDAVGIVDHDTIAGVPEALDAGRKYGVEVVPGVEFSSEFDGRDIHIIGYLMDIENKKLSKYLKLFEKERVKRAEKMVNNLRKMGIQLTIDEVHDKCNGSILGRPHLAEVLMEKGYVETFQEAFHRYLGYGSEVYERKYKIPPDRAIELISSARGLSFLAHPGNTISSYVLTMLIKAGLDGIEVIHPNLSADRTKYLQKIAKQSDLLMSGGSDCHGGRNGLILMGEYKIPYALLKEITNRHKKRFG